LKTSKTAPHQTRRLLPVALASLAIAAAVAVGCGGSDEVAAAPTFGKAEVLHAWTRMEWYWRSGAEAAAFAANGVFKAATLAGVDVDRKGNVYVTTPRWIDQRVPSTLSQVVSVNGKSVLLPFPSWEANAVGDAATRIQNALGVEVDSRNRMWVVDMGWVAGVDPTPDGAQKIIVYDLNTGTELKRYAIPDSVANRNTSFLNDLVIDEKRELAFITDSGNRSGAPVASGLVIYDFKTNTARRVLDRHLKTQDDPSRELTVMGERVLPGGRLAVGINGITLSADGSTLYWNITTGDAIYSAKVDVLLNPASTPAQIDAAISAPARIGGGGDGMSADSKGRFYTTQLTTGKVQYFTATDPALVTIAEGSGLEWPDSLTWDDRGGLIFSTNWLNRAFGGSMNFDQATPNFRIWRIQTDAAKGFVK
jgi:sugar lactone lactonase YvrE